MNLKLKNLLIVLGIGIIIIGFLLGIRYQDSGCGTCGGYNAIIPVPTLAIIYIPSFSKPSPKICSVMGCSAGTTFPIFLDIYGIGLLMFIKGSVGRRKER